MRDNVSKLGRVFPGLGLPTNKAAVIGPTIDLAPYNAATIYILAGTWTDGTHTLTIEESSDGTTFTAVAPTDLVAWRAASPTDATPVKVGNAQPLAISSADTAVSQRVGYLGGKRYLRVNCAVTGTPATGAQYDVVIIAGEPRLLPAEV
jgi:hypothetical protein